MDITNQVKDIVQQVVEDLTTQVQAQVMSTISEQIAQTISRIDMNALFQSALTSAVAGNRFQFPVNSIPAESIDITGFKITGDQVAGGIVTNFGSTGIEDQATTCQLTIMDDVTVVENNLLTQNLTVKGTTTIEGDLNVTGSVPESSVLFQNLVRVATNNVRTSLDQVVFKNYADMVYHQIKTDGLDLNKITFNGQDIISNKGLASTITVSNLQQLGQLKELQVSGETLLSDTLYVTNKRIGVNTIEPAQALSVWDQEVEIGFGKYGTNIAVMGTPRNQSLIISSNGKSNLIATPDGAVAVNQLAIGKVTISAANSPPATDHPKGTIIINSNPSIGGPIGWVSLGEARWANFGIVD
jgi:hypothetical protein